MQDQEKLVLNAPEPHKKRLLQIGTRYLNQTEFVYYLETLSNDELKSGLDHSIEEWRKIHKQIRELEQRAYVAGRQMELIRLELTGRSK